MEPIKPKIFVPGMGLSNGLLWLLVLSGTMIRYLYGIYSHPWLAAPDQLAWQMGLDEMLQTGHWNMLQIGHAPHEAGSALIGLLAVLLVPFSRWLPPLSMAALLIDTLLRLLQIRIAQQLFGRTTAVWFGVWTVLSIPGLLPWSVVNFGLHYPASVFPFVFCWLVNKYREHPLLPIWMGLCCGVAISFAYENCLLIIPAVWILLKGTKNRMRDIVAFKLAFVLAMLPHVLIRLFVELGYPYQQGLLSGRINDLFNSLHPKHLLTVWVTALPGSFLLASPSFIPSIILLILVVGFVYSGMVLFIANKHAEMQWLIMGIFLLFMLAYALGPFSTNEKAGVSYTVYRHLAFILPLLVLLVIHGLLQSRWRYFWLGGWLLVCGVGAFDFMQKQYTDAQTAYRAAGWILVQKYGPNMPKLFRLQAVAANEYHHAIATGLGWGLAASLLRQPGDTIAVAELRSLIAQSPPQAQTDLRNGVQYAFGPGVTPALPFNSLQLFNKKQ